MTKVLHVLDSFGMGGAETWLLGQLHYVAKHPEVKLKLSFLLTGDEVGDLSREFEKFNPVIYRMRISKFLKLRDLKKLRNIIKSGEFDAIHFHQDYTSGLIQALLVGRLSQVVVNHFHNPRYQQDIFYNTSFRRNVMLKLGKVICAISSTHFIGTSWKILDLYQTDIPLFSQIHKEALYCFFDVSRFISLQQHRRIKSKHEPYDILFIGRLDSSTRLGDQRNHKNSALALYVIRELTNLGVNLNFHMIGKSSHATRAHQALISQLGLEKQVVIHGTKNDILPFFANAELLLFPSREEGMGMVAIEAQAAGLNVLKSHGVPDEVICIPERVKSISLDASIEQWAKAAKEFLERPITNSTIDREQFEKFDIEVQFQKLIDIYNGQEKNHVSN